ncbi:hypothetical protein M569_04024, partial [Genlisea aurea]
GAGKKIFPRGKLPQAGDVRAAATWGVAAATTGLYLVQPFEWLRKTFFDKSEAE